MVGEFVPWLEPEHEAKYLKRLIVGIGFSKRIFGIFVIGMVGESDRLLGWGVEPKGVGQAVQSCRGGWVAGWGLPIVKWRSQYAPHTLVKLEGIFLRTFQTDQLDISLVPFPAFKRLVWFHFSLSLGSHAMIS